MRGILVYDNPLFSTIHLFALAHLPRWLHQSWIWHRRARVPNYSSKLVIVRIWFHLQVIMLFMNDEALPTRVPYTGATNYYWSHAHILIKDKSRKESILAHCSALDSIYPMLWGKNLQNVMSFVKCRKQPILRSLQTSVCIFDTKICNIIISCNELDVAI